MLSAKENELLTRVGPGTPMGNLLRRFWLPALLSDELPEADGDPIRTRTLGEDLVAFRDSNGEVGIVDAFCPHRRGPMYFGRNEECGLRCVYHGWKFDTTGQCIDMPSEPAESDFKERLRIKAYPTREVGGMIWIYMGPPEHQPARPPELPFTLVPQQERRGLKFLVEANWLQCLEGELDTAHVSFLHQIFGDDGTGLQTLVRNDGYTNDRHPRLFALDTDYGFVYGGRRAQRAGNYYWRVTQMLLPIYALIPIATGYTGGATIWMPVDDNHCWRYLVGGTRTFDARADEPAAVRRPQLPTEPGTFRFPDGVEIDTRLPVYRRTNRYGMDRQKQRTLSFTGIPFIPTQDQAMTEGMGYICDRTQEHLGTSDVAIIHMRRMMLRLVEALQNGNEPYAPSHPELYRVRPLDVVSDNAELSAVLDEFSQEARLPAAVGY
ncbi:MAG: Rieske 2Fe-2S domain-containing protein [Chloroflexi bacterium]|nr:Rieske 2Fe-2S domain-containing protein [Chloroflexota bacterium]MBV9542840.1 Rieske 2Fe-2S domain-containing protein [Chloroflexota bacterium]